MGPKYRGNRGKSLAQLLNTPGISRDEAVRLATEEADHLAAEEARIRAEDEAHRRAFCESITTHVDNDSLGFSRNWGMVETDTGPKWSESYHMNLIGAGPTMSWLNANGLGKEKRHTVTARSPEGGMKDYTMSAYQAGYMSLLAQSRGTKIAILEEPILHSYDDNMAPSEIPDDFTEQFKAIAPQEEEHFGSSTAAGISGTPGLSGAIQVEDVASDKEIMQDLPEQSTSPWRLQSEEVIGVPPGSSDAITAEDDASADEPSSFIFKHDSLNSGSSNARGHTASRYGRRNRGGRGGRSHRGLKGGRNGGSFWINPSDYFGGSADQDEG